MRSYKDLFSQDVLDSLSTQIAILDKYGAILCVNQSWKNFTKSNSMVDHGEIKLEGENYLSVCKSAIGPYSEEASLMASGIQSIINGHQNNFSIEYPCHTESKNRWFIAKISKFYYNDELHIVVAHENITDRKNAELIAKAENRKFKELTEGLNASAIVAMTDSKGKIIFTNEKFVEISGYTKEELIGKDHRILNSGYHPKVFFSCMWKTISDNKVWVGEICNRKKDGAIYWVYTSISTVHDIHGKKQYLSIRFEITEQKNQELQLKESNELWQFALEGSGEGVWDWNILDQTVIFSNKCKEILQLEDKSKKTNLENLKNKIHPEDLAHYLNNLESHLRTRTAYFSEYRIISNDGSYKWILDRGMVMSRDNNLQPTRMVGTLTDITKLKQTEQKLIQTSKLASIGEIYAGVAHEINNPLAIISGSASLLLNYFNDPEKMKSKIEAIQSSCLRISKIIGGLKKFSRSSESVEYSICNVSDIVSEAVKLTSIKSKQNNVFVSTDLKSESLIRCNEIEIEQVFINLINNAIDAVKELTEKLVKIEITDNEKFVILKVIDSGLGIPLQVQKKIFDPFYTTKPIGEGTGLGLSITKGILDHHKAIITIDSKSPNTCIEIQFHNIVANSAN